MQTPSQRAFGLALLLGIVAYFWSVWTPRVSQAVEAEEAGPSPVVDLQVPPQEESGGCQGRLTALFRSGAEVAFHYEGTAEEVRVTWPGGEYRARTADTCTGTECRFTLPRPGMAGVRIALDSCPPEPAP
ncbi:hypothetical protein AV953_gp04 [Thermus virus IN93]|uniref:Uncharacterized protein n=1 Tax=Thermus virus IN93 TaxID=1714273 RepID=Q859T7_9VIRU|nr:hypothetical protein AV953_gp04 [Thermus virus IN93]BAC55284.1 hypothetical protein [Thermus virus IN93]